MVETVLKNLSRNGNEHSGDAEVANGARYPRPPVDRNERIQFYRETYVAAPFCAASSSAFGRFRVHFLCRFIFFRSVSTIPLEASAPLDQNFLIRGHLPQYFGVSQRSGAVEYGRLHTVVGFVGAEIT